MISILLIYLSGLTISQADNQASLDSTHESSPEIQAISGYKLNITDELMVHVYDEPDLTLTQRIDGTGRISMPLIGEVSLAGLTIRQAETKIQQTFIEKRILRTPQVTISIKSYAPQGISIFGQVKNPGLLEFPKERDTIDIVEAISRAGGFTGIARSSSVLVTRQNPQDGPATLTVNVNDLISERRSSANKERILLYPGDIVYVPERLF